MIKLLSILSFSFVSTMLVWMLGASLWIFVTRESSYNNYPRQSPLSSSHISGTQDQLSFSLFCELREDIRRFRADHARLIDMILKMSPSDGGPEYTIIRNALDSMNSLGAADKKTA